MHESLREPWRSWKWVQSSFSVGKSIRPTSGIPVRSRWRNRGSRTCILLRKRRSLSYHRKFSSTPITDIQYPMMGSVARMRGSGDGRAHAPSGTRYIPWMKIKITGYCEQVEVNSPFTPSASRACCVPILLSLRAVTAVHPGGGQRGSALVPPDSRASVLRRSFLWCAGFSRVSNQFRRSLQADISSYIRLIMQHKVSETQSNRG